MSSMIRLFTIFSLFPAVIPSGDLWELTCEPAVGIVAETTVIRCSIKSSKDIEIIMATLKKNTEDQNIFEINDKKTENQRFTFENRRNNPSLRISDTKFSDEGEYEYRVITDSGEKSTQFSISVTAKYKTPITNTWPKNVTDGKPADLYCNATDGYPAGFIHWFDNLKTNWTVNSILEKVPKGTNGLKSVALSSKLSFNSIDLSLAPFRCVVLNSKYEEVGENTLQITSTYTGDSKIEHFPSNTKHAIAGVMVIGSLIVGLLFALLFFRRRTFSQRRRSSAHPILSNTDYEQGETTDKDQQLGNSA